MREDATPWKVRPHRFDVMWARFPYHGEGGRPAKDLHPTLACTIAEDSTGLPWVGCYYGTSKMRLADREEFDLIIMNPEAIERMALRTATRFDLGRAMWLPFTDAYFVECPQNPGSPIYAKAPDSVIQQLFEKLRWRKANNFTAHPIDPLPMVPPYVPEGTSGPEG